MENKNDSQEIKETKQAINKAKEKLEQLSETKYERELAELREKYVRDQYSVQKYGYLKGIEEEKIRVAKKLLIQKVDVEIIAECTGLSKEEIKKLL